CHTSGFYKRFNQNLDNKIGKCVYLEIGENKANYLVSHPYGQIVRNAACWAGYDAEVIFPKMNWIGSISGDWSDPLQWNLNRIPRSCDDIYLPDSIQSYEVNISTGNFVIRSIHAGQNAQLILQNPHQLTIKP
ncbi:MAG: hypothetical protein WAT79_05250, partial [Saprospiraceae bacterium]